MLAKKSTRLVRALTLSAATLTIGTLSATLALGSPASAETAPAASVDRQLKDSRLVESSGLARSGYDDHILWTHNDTGDSPRLFAVGQAGNTRAVLQITGAKAVDWEAMARLRRADGSSFLYIADIGDNDRVRSEIQVYRVAEPRTLADSKAPATTYRFRYASGRHDAETILVDPRSGRLYVVTKNYTGGAVYVAPSTLSTTSVNTLTKIGTAPSTITDGTFLWDGRIVLRNYTNGFVAAAPGKAYSSFLLPKSGQGESITSAPAAKTILTGSEGLRSTVWKLGVPAAP